MPASKEPQVSPKSPVPAGYRFVPRGNVYITANCRKKTHAAGATVYLVVDPSVRGRANVKGIRVPSGIHDEVVAAEQQTRAKRAAQVRAKDDAGSSAFESEVRRLFPHAPADSVAAISRHALVKRSRRVGRSTMMDMEHKVRLAVVAHIRHVETDYEALLRKGGIEREDARRQTWKRTNEVADRWAGQRNSLSTRSTARREKKMSNRESTAKQGANAKAGKASQKKKRSTKTKSGNKKQDKKSGKPQTRTNQVGKSGKGKKRTRQQAALGDDSANKRDDATTAKPAASVATTRAKRSKGNFGGTSNLRGTPYNKRDLFEVADDDDELASSDESERSADGGDDDEEDGAELSDDSSCQSSELDDGSEDEAQFTDYEGFDSDDVGF
ncbi:hypothetical protein GGTG_01131 [Gaeumannomyces tritici R3-111a-1]|uniref:DUF2293 domain-containing protein n=1 Tax=Gaeumannomyces tritici (strain R3-111a-1) TaxID=644352 RepID=J3NIP8_GAET3|nr:hypothetical protein GGTG_01131 [Gaeumannomyces tritici R3-111a-1]EJT81147.1 hypothetical protein GGTG_01131 [Gaeumannomyces tritici R3-111a-1]